MATPPGKVIRSLRQALDMTQAEFARASGWSASTISSWERGTTTPNRVAFKTILAFAEARGVQYRPHPEGAAAAPAPGLPTLRLGSRLPAPPLAAREARRDESFGSRRWTDVAESGAVIDVEPVLAGAARADAFDARVAAIETARSAWTLDAHVRVELGHGARWARHAAAFGAVLAALAIGAGAGVMLRSGRATTPVTGQASEASRGQASDAASVSSTEAARASTRGNAGASTTGQAGASAARAARAPIEVGDLALAGVGAPLGPAPYAAAAAAEPPPAEIPAAMPAPEHARLESIVALDGTRRATFRVGDRSIALVEGDDLGGRTIALIANDEVALVGGGVATRVRLGFETPIH